MSHRWGSQPTHIATGGEYAGLETLPMCAGCKYKIANWMHVKDCAKCNAYLCNICSKTSKCK